MNRIKSSVVASSLVALLAATAAHAATPYPFGWYVEGNVGKSVSSDKTYPGRVTNTGFGWNLNGGYKFNEYIAGEVGFTRYAQTYAKGPNHNTFETDNHYSYDLAGKLMLPIMHTGLDIFGKLGLGRLNSYTELTNPGVANANHYVVNTGVHSHNVVYFGGGAEFAILANLLANAQWERAKGTHQTGDQDLYSLGLAFIF